MCGRYTIATTIDALARHFHVTPADRRLAPTYNAAPSQALPIICNASPHTMTVSAWGFIPEWADGRAEIKPLINARGETVATKPTFRQAFRSKRCLVVADGFYEWKRAGKRKVPYRIALQSGEPFAFAGLWSTVHDAAGQPYTTFTIITTEANALVSQVHNRMPVMLHAHHEADWLNPQLVLEDVQALLRPFPADRLSLVEVSPNVNSPAYNTPELLRPVPNA